MKNSDLFDKNCTQEKVKRHIQHKEMNHNRTGKLQITLLSAYIS